MAYIGQTKKLFDEAKKQGFEFDCLSKSKAKKHDQIAQRRLNNQETTSEEKEFWRSTFADQNIAHIRG